MCRNPTHTIKSDKHTAPGVKTQSKTSHRTSHSTPLARHSPRYHRTCHSIEQPSTVRTQFRSNLLPLPLPLLWLWLWLWLDRLLNTRRFAHSDLLDRARNQHTTAHARLGRRRTLPAISRSLLLEQRSPKPFSLASAILNRPTSPPCSARVSSSSRSTTCIVALATLLEQEFLLT